MMNKILRYTLAGLFAVLSVFFLLPLTMGVRHMGVFFPILIFLIFLFHYYIPFMYVLMYTVYSVIMDNMLH